jgi:hypothetical protein
MARVSSASLSRNKSNGWAGRRRSCGSLRAVGT